MECDHNFMCTERHEGIKRNIFRIKKQRNVVFIVYCTKCGEIKSNWVDIPVKLINEEKRRK